MKLEEIRKLSGITCQHRLGKTTLERTHICSNRPNSQIPEGRCRGGVTAQDDGITWNFRKSAGITDTPAPPRASVQGFTFNLSTPPAHGLTSKSNSSGARTVLCSVLCSVGCASQSGSRIRTGNETVSIRGLCVIIKWTVPVPTRADVTSKTPHQIGRDCVPRPVRRCRKRFPRSLVPI